MCAARFWLGTLFDWTPLQSLPAAESACVWLKGQEEICPTTSRHHFQVLAGFSRAVRLPHVQRHVGAGHWEATRSAAADDYVHKDDTAVPDTRFELGRKSFRRNNACDWAAVVESAKAGDLSLVLPSHCRYLPMSLFAIILPSSAFLPIMRYRLQLCELASFTMDQQALVKVGAPGKKQVNVLMLKIHAQSGGAVTEVRSMLSLMNFEEVSTLRTCCAGWIGTPLVWKLKEELDPLLQSTSGSHQICTPTSGTP